MISEIVRELAENKIPVELVMDDSGKLIYRISGFSKSGTADMYEVEDRIFLKTRYSKIVEIGSFEDVSYEAFEWYLNYKDRNPFDSPDSRWLPIWLREGRLKEKTEIKYIIT